MKKLLFLLILTGFLSSFLAAEISYSVLNEFNFTLSDRIIENRSYFSDKIQLQMQYSSFRSGLKFEFYSPRFDKFLLINDNMSDESIESTLANNEEDESFLSEYYLQYESTNLFAQIGTFEAVIGTGMVLHNFYDEDFEEDSSLMGAYFNPVFNKWQAQLFAGFMESAVDEKEEDQLAAVDLDFFPLYQLQLGASYVMHKQFIDDDEYNQRDIISGKLIYSSDLFEFNTEYAQSNDEEDLEGTALYTNLITYAGKFTVTASYKNYENFDVKISDLPIANHSGQQLAHGWEVGEDEEGVMGEIRFLPDYENEFVVNYAEGWSSDYNVRQSDLYTEFKHDFEELSVKLEYSALEQLNENSNIWNKELTPALTVDMLVLDNPLLIKAEYQYKEDENAAERISHYEPKLQTDLSLGNYSFSLTVESQIGEAEDGEDGDFWIGAEIATTIFSNTDIRLFGGKEKGGIVCRNGVCKNQAAFNGIRLNIITSF
jgi:predicted porin